MHSCRVSPPLRAALTCSGALQSQVETTQSRWGERALPGLTELSGGCWAELPFEGKPADSEWDASVWLREPFPRLAVARSEERFSAVSSLVPSQGIPCKALPSARSGQQAPAPSTCPHFGSSWLCWCGVAFGELPLLT